MKNLYILSCAGDGEIVNKHFWALELAQQEMLRLFVQAVTRLPYEESEYKGKPLADCQEDGNLVDEEIGTVLGEMNAYFYDEKTMKEYVWGIEEIDLEEEIEA